MTPEELRKEANAAEFMAQIVSYGRDKEWLTVKAAALRHEADRLEQRSWAPEDRSSTPERRAKSA